MNERQRFDRAGGRCGARNDSRTRAAAAVTRRLVVITFNNNTKVLRGNASFVTRLPELCIELSPGVAFKKSSDQLYTIQGLSLILFKLFKLGRSHPGYFFELL